MCKRHAWNRLGNIFGKKLEPFGQKNNVQYYKKGVLKNLLKILGRKFRMMIFQENSLRRRMIIFLKMKMKTPFFSVKIRIKANAKMFASATNQFLLSKT